MSDGIGNGRLANPRRAVNPINRWAINRTVFGPLANALQDSDTRVGCTFVARQVLVLSDIDVVDRFSGAPQSVE